MKGLNKHISGKNALYYSDEIAEAQKDEDKMDFDPGLGLEEILEFFDDPLKNEIIELNAKLHGLEGTAVLNAHGGDDNGKWVYQDGHENYFSVQKWVNELDGRYALLCLCCCNPGHNEIHSRKSAVLVANNDLDMLFKDSGRFQVELYLPKRGYITDYIFEYELGRLRKKVNP